MLIRNENEKICQQLCESSTWYCSPKLLATKKTKFELGKKKLAFVPDRDKYFQIRQSDVGTILTTG